MSVIVDQLLMRDVHVGDALLRAVDVGYLETVKKICEYALKLETPDERQAVLDCHCDNDDFHPDVTPVVLAAQRNDFSMIKTLLNSGTTIVNVTSKNFATKATDELQKSVGTLELYRGLASEAYITLANGDPVDRAFVMSHTLKKLSHTDVEFKSSYLELANTIDQVGTDIISHARTTEEIMTVLTHYEPTDDTPNVDQRTLGPLPKLARAIDFDQRKVTLLSK
ncbi:transient receptor potential protein-like [Amphiura filiformis]|uniref:transient receptor potential protein-like n=1 Tax=Amphiura filiformis TaxID=82378 RepID=UPI003B2116A3